MIIVTEGATPNSLRFTCSGCNDERQEDRDSDNIILLWTRAGMTLTYSEEHPNGRLFCRDCHAAIFNATMAELDAVMASVAQRR